MSGLSWRTAGESHGPCLVGLVEGIPSGLPLEVGRIDAELARRQRGYGRGGRMRIEEDRVQILSGWKGGITIGAPIAFRIENRDHTIERLPVPGDARPGHADLAGCQKHGHRDPRAVLERASARETAARVAAGAIARQLLERLGIEVFAHVVELGGVRARGEGAELDAAQWREVRDASDFFSLDPQADPAMRAAVDAARADGDTLGGVFEVRASGHPPGLGGYASADQRLSGRLGGALLSIPAIKGVEIGLGFESARVRGSACHDAIVSAASAARRPRFGRYGRATNRAGGLEGGMTTGEELVLRAAMKPIPTLRRGLPTVDFESAKAVDSTYQRSDVSSVPAASVVGEALVALVLAQALLEKLGGDSLAQVERSLAAYARDLEGV